MDLGGLTVEIATEAARAWLSALFVYSGTMKLARYDQAHMLLLPYGFGANWSRFVGLGLPWVEFAAGSLTLLGWLNPVGPVLCGASGFSFAAVSLLSLSRGAMPPCGCTGNMEEGDSVGIMTVARATTMIGAAALLIVTAPPTSLSWFAVAATLLATAPGIGVIRARKAQAQKTAAGATAEEQTVAALVKLLNGLGSEPVPAEMLVPRGGASV